MACFKVSTLNIEWKLKQPKSSIQEKYMMSQRFNVQTKKMAMIIDRVQYIWVGMKMRAKACVQSTFRLDEIQWHFWL